MELARKPLKFINQPLLNIVILNLTISDMFLWSGYYLISPILALFLHGKLGDDAARVVGVGVGIYFFVRSVFQLPIGLTMDKLKKYVDEAFFVGAGALFMGLSIFGYQFIESEYHTYLLQFLFGLGAAMNVPAWRKMFSKFLDHNREGLEWSIYDIAASLSMASAAAIGGTLALTLGYGALFNFAAMLMFMSGMTPLLLIKVKRVHTTN